MKTTTTATRLWTNCRARRIPRIRPMLENRTPSDIWWRVAVSAAVIAGSAGPVAGEGDGSGNSWANPGAAGARASATIAAKRIRVMLYSA